ncbi:glycoside hydrolase family 3 C-terminal domain-containing protein [Lactococcus carnosus]|uniref:Glycoside hydrolase family 3 protein n=2 Tax=Pseudolactococcus carnosus TaxID=2749961 RepID=A0ABT0AV66_9LACT|nr:glycoside hydrolase family 3 C-terminal domain-containing protein [Lactococcus carnosus]MCJ1990558.1 glycoside hydrolase family 3 protein [Lactococcus carnosus]
MTITHQEARKQAIEIVSRMSLAEKISQIDFDASAIERLGIPHYNYWNEALHGVARAGVATVFPQAIGLAATFDKSLVQAVAEAISVEGRAKYNAYSKYGDRDIYKGLTFWSPNINLFRDPRWGRGQETYGEDPYLTAQIGIAFIKGLQGDGKYLRLAACAKHFAVHSGPEEERHYFDAVVNPKDLSEFYLPQFEAAIKEADVEAFMGAYNAVNGQTACVNEQLIKEILLDKWGFEGHVVSDYMALEDVHENHHYTKTAAETMALAMKIGTNLCAGKISDALFEAVGKGLVTEDEIAASVVKLYTTRVRLGMFATDNEDDQIPYEANASKAHEALSLKAAEKSMVLLKNDHFLPLEKARISSVAVIGPTVRNIGALAGNYAGTANQYVTFDAGIRQVLSEDARVTYALGCHLYADHAESSLSRANERESEAVIAAAHADITVLCLGLDPTIEGEQGDSGNVYGSGDKASLSLPGQQKCLLEKVLATGKPVIVVLTAGSALSLDGLEGHPNVKAIIHAWYPGSHGGRALANILFGDASPSGKLPVTFYKDTVGLPDFSDYSMSERTYQNTQLEVLYPFGYGLTYGRAVVKSATLEDLALTITLSNAGEYACEEVLQVYAKIASEFAPKHHKLIAFERVVLPKAEDVQVTVHLKSDSFKVVNTQGEWIADGATAILSVDFGQPTADSLLKTISLTEVFG